MTIRAARRRRSDRTQLSTPFQMPGFPSHPPGLPAFSQRSSVREGFLAVRQLSHTGGSMCLRYCPCQARAGDGNRTHTTSLEGWSSTIELHPQRLSAQQPGGFNSAVAGAGFEPAKALPPDLQSGPFGHSGIPPNLIRVAGCPYTPSINLVSTEVVSGEELAVGFEPTTTGLQNRDSTVELR